jgi:MinD superfamily P-loop ATPase
VKVAVASGKGGTGKTTVAVNLARTAAEAGQRVQLLDCDVEEPNCALFLQPELERTLPVEVTVPQVDEQSCTHCGVCSQVCEFHAIVSLPTTVLVFPELCHSCGACALLCPQKAIFEVRRGTGAVHVGSAGPLSAVSGELNVGEAKATPVVKAVRDQIDNQADLVVIDAPPGTSCPVIESVRGTDLVLLVSEPTPFGLHDLELAVETIRVLGLPMAVVANRSDIGDDRLRDYCEREGIQILLELPHDRRLAEAYSRGQLAVDALPEYRDLFATLWQRIATLARQQEATLAGASAEQAQ